jgi:hypothetical protein
VLQSVPESSALAVGLFAAGLLAGRWAWKTRGRSVTA